MARAASPAAPTPAPRKRPRASAIAASAAAAASESARGMQQQRRRPLPAAADAEEKQLEEEDDEDDEEDEEDDEGDDDDDDKQEETKDEDEGGDGGGKDAGEEEKPKPKRGRRRLLHDEEQRKQRRKNQCKLNQRRYRARQRGMISTLSLETDALGDFIRELEAYERFLRQYAQCEEALAAAGGPTNDGRPLLVVAQFLQFFEHGFALHSVEISDIQERFVRFVSAPDLVSQGASRGGADALLLQLKRYTSYHARFQLRADGPPRVVHAAGAWVVQASGRMHLRLSRDTVMLVYPHIVKDEALSYRVVGHEIAPRFRLALQFDERGKLCKLELSVDFAGAFVALLHSAELVAELLGRALISPHCELGIDPHEEEAAVGGENKQLRLKFILL